MIQLTSRQKKIKDTLYKRFKCPGRDWNTKTDNALIETTVRATMEILSNVGLLNNIEDLRPIDFAAKIKYVKDVD